MAWKDYQKHGTSPTPADLADAVEHVRTAVLMLSSKFVQAAALVHLDLRRQGHVEHTLTRLHEACQALELCTIALRTEDATVDTGER
jgi:hypothetical protein